MQNDDYIDELFACKLGSMEATPPEDGWFRIETELNRRKQMARKYWLAAASLALILSVTATVLYIQTNFPTNSYTEAIAIVRDDELVSDSPDNNEIAGQTRDDVVQNRNDTQSPNDASEELVSASPEDIEIAGQARDDVQQARDDVEQAGNDVEQAGNDIEQTHNDVDYALSDAEQTFNEMEQASIQTPPIENFDYTYNNIEPEKIIPDIIAQFIQKEPENQPEKPVSVATIVTPLYEDIIVFDLAGSTYGSSLRQPSNTLGSRQRWHVSGQFAPMQSYRVVSSVPAGLRKSDFDDAESPLITYSGGISLSYRAFKRLSIQTGVLYTQMGQSINDVTPVNYLWGAVSSNNQYTKNFVRTSSGSVSVVSNLKSDVNSTYSSYFNSEPMAINTPTSSTTKYQLIERIDYLEIPLTVRYKVIDRKISFQVLGGMSANVLLDTNVFIDNGSEALKSGTILMARPVNYSSTLGLGIEYLLKKNLSIALEPTFKYYLQSYTTNSKIGTNPYAIGIFTGAVYRF